MKYKWCIPSYKRSDKPYTVDLLRALGYEKGEIIVSTQTEEDYEEYKSQQGDKATIIYSPAENDSQNRNAVLEYMRAERTLLLADDDIKAIMQLTPDGRGLTEIKSGEAIESLFAAMFCYARKNKAKIWALYPVENAYFMSHTIDRRNILCGTVFGIVNDPCIRFDNRYDLKGDYELSLRLISRGQNAIRFNGYTCKANHRSAGGCDSARKAGLNKRFYEELVYTYSDLVRPSKRTGEIRYIGKTGKEPEEKLWI